MHSDMIITRRARTAWREAGLEPIGLQECRHTYAAFMIAVGPLYAADRRGSARAISAASSSFPGMRCP